MVKYKISNVYNWEVQLKPYFRVNHATYLLLLIPRFKLYVKWEEIVAKNKPLCFSSFWYSWLPKSILKIYMYNYFV